MAFSFFGQPSQNERLPILSQQQISNQNQYGQLALQGLQQYNPQKFNFQPIADQAQKNFQTKTIPTLADRFTSLGSGPNSSQFRSAYAGAGADLQGQHS